MSPAEPAQLRALGEVSLKTEEYGCDFLYVTRVGLVGVQRKEYGDLLASVTGDRLYRELLLMKRLDQAVLLVEGRPQWTNDGQLLSRQQWTLAQHVGLLSSIQSEGVWVHYTSNLAESAMVLQRVAGWFNKDTHTSLLSRPKPQTSWGFRTDVDWACHVLMSFPNIGPQTAKNIYHHFGNCVPLRWECTEEELMKVPGVGKVRAKKLMEALNE